MKISYGAKHKKTWKINDFSTFLVCIFSLFIFFLHFFIRCLELMNSVFWEVATSLFQKFSCLKWKFLTVQNTKKNEKLTIFRLFWFVTFRFSFFLLHFFILCLELMKSVFWEVGTCFFQKFSCLKVKISVQNTKNMKN